MRFSVCGLPVDGKYASNKANANDAPGRAAFQMRQRGIRDRLIDGSACGGQLLAPFVVRIGERRLLRQFYVDDDNVDAAEFFQRRSDHRRSDVVGI